MARPRIVVFGAGSRMMSDERVGVAITEELARHPLPDNVTVREVGTDGYGLLSDLADADVAIVVDCARMGLEPGSVVVFGPEEVEDRLPDRRISLHSISLLGVVRLAERLGYGASIRIVAVEPQSVEPGEELSEPVAAAVPRALALIGEEIRRASQLRPRSRKPN